MISVNTKLVEPVLAPGQVLSGFVLRKMISAKPVYIRPSMEILAPESLALQWVRQVINTSLLYRAQLIEMRWLD